MGVALSLLKKSNTPTFSKSTAPFQVSCSFFFGLGKGELLSRSTRSICSTYWLLP